MKKTVVIAATAVLAGGWFWSSAPKGVEEAAPESAYASPEYLALSADGGSVFVTAATGARIVNLALDGSAVRMWKIESHTAEKQVPVNPTGIAARGDDVWVTAGVQCGELQHFGSDGTLKGQVAVGHSPCGPVVSKDGKKVWVLNRFANRVTCVDAASMKVVATVNVLREPFVAAFGADEKLLFVANLLPYVAATNDVVSAAVSMIDAAAGKVVKHLPLPNGATGVRGLCAAPDGSFVYVAHTMGRYQLPTTQLERGWMNTAAVSVFCGKTGAYVNTFLLDDDGRGAANPWGIAVSPDGKHLCVNHAATCELSIIDRAALHQRLDAAAKGVSASGIVKQASDVPNDLAFLVSIRRRVLLGGPGPRGLVLTGNTAVSALYFEDALACVNLADGAARVVRVAPAKDITKDRVRRGEMLYNSGTMCFQQWQSCASCHPDGRVDGLNWDLLNDGVGNPKQTKSQVYGQFTPPTMATGIRKDLKECNRAGLIHIQFVQRPEEDALCLDAYTESIKPVPSPYLVNGKLSERARRGEKIYEKAQCNLCHGANQAKTPEGKPLYTDCKLYDVGLMLNRNASPNGKFDTPALTEVWRSAPYLYDGRALTMEDVLRKDNPNDTHGVTSSLTDEEIKDLAEYVLSL